jgi:hypothetical protein
LPEQCLFSLFLSVDGECFCVCCTFLFGFHFVTAAVALNEVAHAGERRNACRDLVIKHERRKETTGKT